MLFSTGLIDAVLDSGWDTVFTNPVLELRDGTPPAHPDDAISGNMFCSVALPVSGYFTAAAGGVKNKAGSWSGTVSFGGTPIWFRIRDGSDTNGASTTAVRIDGTVGVAGSGADLILDALPLVSGDTVDIATFAISQGQNVIDVDGGGTLL